MPEPEDWERILKDDGYRSLVPPEPPDIGDVVVYRKKNDDEILHVARVCRFDQLSLPGDAVSSPTPRALSKLDLTSGEVVHALSDLFLNGGEEFEVVIYTDRPKP